MRYLPGLGALALVLAGPAMSAEPPTATLVVSAEASRVAAPDLAILSAGVVTQAPDAAAAMAENNRRMTAVTAALRRAGVEPRDLRTSQLAVQPLYRYGENRAPTITGYQAANQVTVRLRDLARIGPVVDAMVKEGANRIEGPSFTVEKPEPLLDAARADAVKAARARAELLAAAAGVRIVRVLTIQETGGGPEFRPMARAMAAAPASDMAPPVEVGESELRAGVTVTFEIAPGR
ncbi:SIMPL domain-containing protein [Thermaurantiacus sp.]